LTSQSIQEDSLPETIDEEQFRQDAMTFLEANAKPRQAVRAGWGEGSDRVGLLSEHTPEEELEQLRAGKEWKRQVFDAGFGWITGPRRYGGRELPKSYERVYQAAESRFDIPSTSAFGIGLGMVAPTILAHATDEVKDAYLQKLYRGDIVACQLFSEPTAGSDLAGLRSTAVRDGDEWVINGQKVWTSGAQFSDIGEIICRTDPDAPKHKGLTAFVVNMLAPGVEVRPLRQMTGGASFNEVFFTDVRVPDDHRLGDVNQGWTVALTTLMNERASIGGGGGGLGTLGSQRFIEMARSLGRAGDPIARQRLADVYIHGAVARYTNMRAMARIKAGQLPGPEMSIAKLSLTLNFQRIANLVSLLLGPRLVADTGEWGTYAWAEFVLGVPGVRVAGGTDEVMRNIVGERVLGLPKEPRGDT
jgi:acyl-CoA dehydrogenase